jgi:hypothetical protein
MYRETEIQAYREAIQIYACSRCPEKLAGGPPCEPLGKRCALELHLPDLLDAVRAVRSAAIEPYLESIHRRVCNQCSLPGLDCCPCPTDYMLILAVRAIDTMDQELMRSPAAEDRYEGYPGSVLDRIEDE